MAAVSGGDSATRTVRRWLREEYAPRGLVLTDSGTSALTLALRAVRAKHSDGPIVLPAYSCYDLATAAAGADVPVLLYDVDPRTLGPDIESLESVLRRGAAAVVVAHLYGVPACTDAVLDLVRKAGATLIEDAAQAAGGQYCGNDLGTFGDLSVLSFGRGKGTTGGGGGALMVHEREWEERVERIGSELKRCRPRGWTQIPKLLGQWLLGRPSVYGLPANVSFLRLGETVYREPKPPEALPALAAGVLSRTLEDRASERRARQRNARWLRKLIAQTTSLTPIEVPSQSEPGYLRFPVLASSRCAQRLQGSSAETLGVMPGYPKPLNRLPALRDRCQNPSHSVLGAETLTRQLFTLPTHSRVDDRDRQGFAELLRSVDAAGSTSPVFRGMEDSSAEIEETSAPEHGLLAEGLSGDVGVGHHVEQPD